MNRKSKNKRAKIAEAATINIVVDTPQGSRNKFKFDEQHGVFKLSKMLPEGMVFPYDFGFVPSTRGEDGDPLDVLVLIEEPTFCGCILECSLIGVIEAQQRKGNDSPARNDRLIAAARASLLFSDLTQITQIPPAILKDVEEFFVNYDRLRDVEFRVLGRGGPARAREILEAARTVAAASEGTGTAGGFTEWLRGPHGVEYAKDSEQHS